MSEQNKVKILKIARDKGIIRPKDIEAAGISREYLIQLHKEGRLERAGRGLYHLPGALMHESRNLAEVTIRVPHCVICLISALSFHGLTTEIPHAVWIAIENKRWTPKIDYPPVMTIRMSDAAIGYGVETHFVEKTPIRVFSAPKTIADCFKYRKQVGIDTAIAALKDGLMPNKCTVTDIWKAAQVCRVAAFMRPYLEALA